MEQEKYSIYNCSHVDIRSFFVNEEKFKTAESKETRLKLANEEASKQIKEWQEKVQQDKQQTKNAPMQQSK